MPEFPGIADVPGLDALFLIVNQLPLGQVCGVLPLPIICPGSSTAAA